MRLLRTLPLAVTLFVFPAAAQAQGIIIPRCPPGHVGEPIVDCPRPIQLGQQVVRTRSDVRVELRDRVLRYEVEERFLNRGNQIGEADYVFPLPKNAAFRDLKLSIDGQLVSGETMGANDARRIYEDIVRRQRDPALVEWMGHGLLRTRIFPIQPGEERRVVVRFESVAEREGDALRVDYMRGGSDATFTLSYLTGGELGEPYSPTHELDVARDGLVRRVTTRGGAKDITVLVALRQALTASVGFLPYADRGEPGFALITVTPPAELAQNRAPRDITFVLDVSGSMSGRKLEQAKAAGRRLLQTLTDRDRFRLIDFSTDVHTFRDGFTYATQQNIDAALRYLDNLDAVGSTNISGALDEALRAGVSRDGDDVRDSGRLPLVLFMTDGAPTVGERDPAAIAARAARQRGDARVFTFGLGADVNAGLLEQLALEGHGTAHFVRPEENVERSVELLATRLRQPLLTDVRVSVDGDNVRLSRMYPNGSIDVFAGQDLVLLARYDGSGPARVVVTGRQAGGNGREARWSREVNFPRDEHDNAFVPRLWATQRIGWLSAERRRSGGSTEIDDEIRQLGERFGIPTEFTSYLVQEPGMVANQNLRRMRGDPMPMTSSGGGAAAPSAAPSAVFESARKASAQRAATSIAAADAAVAESTPTEVRHVGTRIFARDGDRWVDSRMKAGLQVYKVKAYSRGYFALLDQIAELREAFTVGDHVLVAGRSVAIEVVDEAPELPNSDIQSIVNRW
ncbi:MAG TPA: VIT domain-containing protein [Gemmatimonadaceae bacterium]|nr:VIT domain-containing protein [Gemmatimonadaceae bacterium]